jgi:hypothetical protein
MGTLKTIWNFELFSIAGSAIVVSQLVLREHDITIAFPQRDVHMNTLSPLQVQLLPACETQQDEDQ